MGISVSSLTLLNGLRRVHFGNSPVRRIVGAGSNCVCILDRVVRAPASLCSFVRRLPRRCSVFRRVVLRSNKERFSGAGDGPVNMSTAKGAVCSSMFVCAGRFFSGGSFDLDSRSLATAVLVFSGSIVGRTLRRTHAALTS